VSEGLKTKNKSITNEHSANVLVLSLKFFLLLQFGFQT